MARVMYASVTQLYVLHLILTHARLSLVVGIDHHQPLAVVLCRAHNVEQPGSSAHDLCAVLLAARDIKVTQGSGSASATSRALSSSNGYHTASYQCDHLDRTGNLRYMESRIYQTQSKSGQSPIHGGHTMRVGHCPYRPGADADWKDQPC